MFALDERTGNVLTTVAAFLAAATVVYFARGVLFVAFIALLLSYLLDPAVSWIEQRQPFSTEGKRSWAIAEVYVLGTTLVGSLAFCAGSAVVSESRKFSGAFLGTLAGLSSGQMPAPPPALSLGLTQQEQINVWLGRPHNQLVQLFERGTSSVAQVAGNALWLLVAPILAIFILRDGPKIIEGLRNRAEQTAAVRIIVQVNAMLARYIRAQLALAALAFVFYAASMLLLRFPYAFPLALLGGVLEMLPALGCTTAAAVILLTGYLMHAHWIWMACLLIVWRLVQDYVNSPRITGNNVDLPAFVVIVALMIGGQAGGIAGAYLAVPIAATVRIAWSELHSLASGSEESSRGSDDRRLTIRTASQGA